jgi:3-deoxy-D-manno-octulosonic-acid transferase
MYLVYNTALALALLLGCPYFLFQAVRHGKYRKGLFERLGRVPARLQQSRPSIWIHAVSVGEVLAVSELVRALRREFPELKTVVSTTTDTGQKLVASRFGDQNVFYFPFDFSFSIRPWLSALQPRLLVIAETELWPNFFRLAKQAGARVVVVNARISDRSFRGYRRWRTFLRHILAGVDLFLAQTAEDARRLIAIGAPAEKVLTAGNLKYDVPPPSEPPIVRQLQSALGQSGSVLVCGSTVAGEEELLLDAFHKVSTTHPRAVMLLAPRHPERFDEVAGLVEQSNIPLTRRSQWNGGSLTGAVLLIDSIGELSSLYALADLAFVGGSLVPRGGHNIIEPAQHGVPILVGEHTENFRDTVELFKSHNALRVVSPANLAVIFLELLADDDARRSLGQRAIETIRSQPGATQLTLMKIRELLDGSLQVSPA